jgi:hypothetical protein
VLSRRAQPSFHHWRSHRRPHGADLLLDTTRGWTARCRRCRPPTVVQWATTPPLTSRLRCPRCCRRSFGVRVGPWLPRRRVGAARWGEIRVDGGDDEAAGFAVGVMKRSWPSSMSTNPASPPCDSAQRHPPRMTPPRSAPRLIEMRDAFAWFEDQLDQHINNDSSQSKPNTFERRHPDAQHTDLTSQGALKTAAPRSVKAQIAKSPAVRPPSPHGHRYPT